MPLVSGVYDATEDAALRDDQRCFPPPIHSGSDRDVFRWTLEEVARAGCLLPEVVLFVPLQVADDEEMEPAGI